jgi:hypothetical protein
LIVISRNLIFMKYSSYFLTFFLLFSLVACTDNEVDDILIRRNGLVEFSIGSEVWRAQSFQLINLGKAVVFTSPDDSEGTVYQRLFFLISGRNAAGGERKLTMIIDVPDGTRLLGLATRTYAANLGGIRSIEMSDQPQGRNGGFKLYTLSENEAQEAFVEIQRQSLTEKIVAGEFRLPMQDVTDSETVILLDNGIFKDIPYTTL